MLIAIIVYLIIGVIGLYLGRAEIIQVTEYYSSFDMIIFYTMWMILGPIVILYVICKGIFNIITKRES